MYEFNEASGTHQRLMAALHGGGNHGQLLKSQTHAAAFHESLRRGSNDRAHNKPSSDPKGFIRRASPDMTLTPAQRKADERAEKEYLRKMSEARANGGINDEGSFERLKKSLAAKATDSVETIMKSLQTMYGPRASMAKALAEQDASGEGFEERYGIPAHATVAQAVGVKTIRAAVKPAKPVNTIASGFARINVLLKSMGLEASYGTDSATLTGGSAIRKQSLPAKPAAKPLSPDELLKAASTLLHHGRIDTQTAARVQSEVNLTGKVSPALMKTLGEACK
jgi:hypothetical protein